MPIYEYACGKCGKLFEELVFSAADETGVACPACGALEVKRCLSACASVIAGENGGAGALASGGGCTAPGPGGFR
ncbi:MAG: zinc ribbon domain-containing protein [Proteobacteria bacterium]|nr:zinc ribbon domain-containing protein [Pseudomonadota bacterium]